MKAAVKTATGGQLPCRPLPCPLCRSRAGFLLRARDWNRRTSPDWFCYHRCGYCGLIFLANPPSDLAAYYAGDYHALPSQAELERVGHREAYQLEILTCQVRGGRLVEIGPGAGVFAWQAKQAGFRVTTIEMDEGCRKHLEAVVGVEAIQSDRPETALATLPPSRAIVLWQALEHLPKPWAFLERALDNLEPGGVLLVATPNPEALGLRLMRARWPHLDAPRHLQLIPAQLLSEWLSARGASRVALYVDDRGARRWNRFAWQRLFMNAMPRRPFYQIAFAAGALISAAASLIERRGTNPSCYTAVFVKGASK